MPLYTRKPRRPLPHLFMQLQSTVVAVRFGNGVSMNDGVGRKLLKKNSILIRGIISGVPSTRSILLSLSEGAGIPAMWSRLVVRSANNTRAYSYLVVNRAVFVVA